VRSNSINQLREALVGKRLSAAEAARRAVDAANRLNPQINTFTQAFHDEPDAQAQRVDQKLSAHGRFGPFGGLPGVPIALKDNMCLAWGKTTCASRMLENYCSPYTATAVQRLIDAGAVIVGKTNLDEFAMGSSTEHSLFGPTTNPWDTTRVVGGSSGGSAAAVAARIVPAALGSDTGGSIRQPAGMCNIVGFKPTYGRVSRYGLVAYASSLDQIGPFALTVADAALLTSIMSGRDELDSTTLDESETDLVTGLEEPVNRLVIGVPRQARSSANHPAVAAALENAIQVFRSLGAEVIDVDLPLTAQAIAAYYIIATAEASSNLARFDGVRYGRCADIGEKGDLMALYCRSRAEGFGAEVQRRIMLGTHVLSAGYAEAYYNTALKVRRLIGNDYDRAFGGSGGPTGAASGGCHAILTPSSPNPAWKIGEKAADPLSEYLEDVYTVGANLAGLPAITVPGGFAKGAGTGGCDLPVGVQLIGPSREDAALLRIARMFERETRFAETAPPILN
jgi:aspartyl-tRNA(Asn)/glutamyl-tRNA(Gln) amidotransferase subunit A